MFEEMMDEIIRMFGFEDEKTIQFCQYCEQVEKGEIKNANVYDVAKLFIFFVEE